jgi:hypothetical protein
MSLLFGRERNAQGLLCRSVGQDPTFLLMPMLTLLSPVIFEDQNKNVNVNMDRLAQ